MICEWVYMFVCMISFLLCIWRGSFIITGPYLLTFYWNCLYLKFPRARSFHFICIWCVTHVHHSANKKIFLHIPLYCSVGQIPVRPSYFEEVVHHCDPWRRLRWYHIPSLISSPLMSVIWGVLSPSWNPS